MKSQIVAASVDYNFTNFTVGGLLRVAFDPYYAIFGNLTWGIIFGFIGAGIYANNQSLGTVGIYLIIVGVFFSIVFPIWFVYIFGLLLSFILSTIFYITFVKQRR